DVYLTPNVEHIVGYEVGDSKILFLSEVGHEPKGLWKIIGDIPNPTKENIKKEREKDREKDDLLNMYDLDWNRWMSSPRHYFVVAAAACCHAYGFIYLSCKHHILFFFFSLRR
ncbi:hypothetical protein ACJX0J_016166, partial [Zea mays]